MGTERKTSVPEGLRSQDIDYSWIPLNLHGLKMTPLKVHVTAEWSLLDNLSITSMVMQFNIDYL